MSIVVSYCTEVGWRCFKCKVNSYFWRCFFSERREWWRRLGGPVWVSRLLRLCASSHHAVPERAHRVLSVSPEAAGVPHVPRPSRWVTFLFFAEFQFVAEFLFFAEFLFLAEFLFFAKFLFFAEFIFFAEFLFFADFLFCPTLMDFFTCVLYVSYAIRHAADKYVTSLLTYDLSKTRKMPAPRLILHLQLTNVLWTYAIWHRGSVKVLTRWLLINRTSHCAQNFYISIILLWILCIKNLFLRNLYWNSCKNGFILWSFLLVQLMLHTKFTSMLHLAILCSTPLGWGLVP